jgi:hypothetical protein
MKRRILVLATLGLMAVAPAAVAGDSCDFDGDGSCTAADRDILMGLQGATQGVDADYRADVDLDGDGVISLADAAAWTQLSKAGQ